ncbi:MAG: tetratricopeptide repeat protein [Candidatus Scalindua sp.]|nr:tetratricopeptide repeat protein [Candidatus Scalindua sp.]
MQNSSIKKVLSSFLFFSLYTVLSIHAATAETDSFESAEQLLREGMRMYDTKQIQKAKEIFVEQADRKPADHVSAYYAALSYLALCDVKNFEMRKSPNKAEMKARKEERVILAEEGLTYADRSIELKKDFSESHRVKGALLSNKISGMVSGMRNGKLAEEEITHALKIDNKNIMAQIENARMFINKPRILGGNTQKGIEILTTVIKDFPGLEKGYLNLGIVYYENGKEELAVDTFKKLLEINPDNPEARYFVNHLTILK